MHLHSWINKLHVSTKRFYRTIINRSCVIKNVATSQRPRPNTMLHIGKLQVLSGKHFSRKVKDPQVNYIQLHTRISYVEEPEMKPLPALL